MSQPTFPVKRSWDDLMKKLDGDCLAPKPKAVKKNSTGKPSTTTTTTPDFSHTDFFDVTKHGYFLRNGALIFRMPDGTFVPATGVDSFGPFKDAPRGYVYYNNNNWKKK